MSMTVGEASSVLHGVVNSLKAAKRLEDALKIAEEAEQIVREKTSVRDKLDMELISMRSEKRKIEEDIENEGAKRDNFINEAQILKEKSTTDVTEAHVKSVKDIKDIKEIARLKLDKLRIYHDATMKSLNGQVFSKTAELEKIQEKVAVAESERVSLVEKLG